MSIRSLFQACLLSPLVSVASAGPIFGKIGSFTESQKLSDPNYGPKPGEDPIFSTYYGVEAPFPGNLRDVVLPTKVGRRGVDDEVWQNLLAAEWIIFDFYQKAVEDFNTSSFVAIGMPNTTYQRIQEIRNNEAGHLRIFQNMISPTSVKPGACEHQYPFYDPISFLALVTVLEVSSMAFLTGLVQSAKLPSSAGAMIAIAETEARHEVWSLIEIWKTNPFGGPADTTFPYANQILDSTNGYIVPGSCPPENPVYPNPRQNLPALSAAKGTKSLTPGSNIALNFTDPDNQPSFARHTQYYAVFFHGVYNVSVPIDTMTWPEEQIFVTIPAQFETKGVIVAVIADTPGAPTKDTVVAGPGVILEQPVALATQLL
ncbi:hypothetical protein F4781DRAFT_51539 [Annulohypoxylon bovei var. microspora]|nr:hypothetical protein F4781DRAFT_51539 [Annulohypoxylon bovei var. microspora]